jgi:predicted nucleotidyltransferase
MAEIDVRVIDNVRSFLDKLRLAGIHISKAYLFGSYSKGQADRWSDIDVAVVSPQISGNRFEERVRLAEMAIGIDDRMPIRLAQVASNSARSVPDFVLPNTLQMVEAGRVIGEEMLKLRPQRDNLWQPDRHG